MAKGNNLSTSNVLDALNSELDSDLEVISGKIEPDFDVDMNWMQMNQLEIQGLG